MPLPSFSGDIEKNIIRHIKYRGTIRTGEIIVDNGDGTYDVKIALSDVVYPSIETIHYEMVFAVGEIAVLAFEYGSKENPKIIGHGKKIAQVPVEVEVDYSGTARVETLDAYSITGITAYLEGRIHLGGAGNCTRRGFQYGTTISYGSDTHTDGSYGSGSYAIQTTGLTGSTTYHFRAYIIDENGDTKYGGDKTFITIPMLIDIGCEAIDRPDWTELEPGYTLVNKGNPANASGTITSVEIYNWLIPATGGIVATFSSSGNTLTARDSEYIGDVAAGYNQFGVNLDVEEGDFLGCYLADYSYYEMTGLGAGVLYYSGDQTSCLNQLFNEYTNTEISLYGTGQT